MTSFASLKHSLVAGIALHFVIAAAPVGAKPSNGQKFNAWTARCEVNKETKQSACFLFQNLLLKKEQRPLLHVAVGYLNGTEQPVAIFTVPLGVSLPGGLNVTIDEGKALRVRFERCDETGCLAPLSLSAAVIASLKGGRWARVAFFDPNRREVSVPVSLLGFTAGLKSLD